MERYDTYHDTLPAIRNTYCDTLKTFSVCRTHLSVTDDTNEKVVGHLYRDELEYKLIFNGRKKE